MIFKILQAPDKRLTTVCTPVDASFGTEELRFFALDLVSTRKAYRGAGLAAPQVGKLIRVITVNGHPVMVNPEIIKTGNNKSMAEEGCLSIGGGRPKFRVKRWDTITVKFADPYGDQHELLARGMAARAIQHEIDHLDGKLIA